MCRGRSAERLFDCESVGRRQKGLSGKINGGLESLKRSVQTWRNKILGELKLSRSHRKAGSKGLERKKHVFRRHARKAENMIGFLCFLPPDGMLQWASLGATGDNALSRQAEVNSLTTDFFPGHFSQMPLWHRDKANLCRTCSFVCI